MASSESIIQLRRLFFEKMNAEGIAEDYFHKNDLNRISTTDDWLKRFLIHHDGVVTDALTMLWDTLNWRKENKVNEINESTVNLEFIKDGSMFLHGQDIDGKMLLIFKCKMHVKGQKDWEENKRCIIYWFERAERANKGDQITIFFDMAESGLANMDMDYTKYLIGLCKQYYPNFLNYIIIFEMPWVMNAAFKIIKSWLPAKAVEKIKFISKSSLKDYVLPQHALKCWGGEDEYVFSFVPEVTTEDEHNIAEEHKKRVHFFEGSPGDQSNSASSFCSYESGEAQSIMFVSATKLRISPPDCVVFKKDDVGDVSGTISITNLNNKNIAFKIKTTSPENFRVRPGSGLLGPDEKVDVCVSLLEGVYARDIVKDKFLVMSTVLNEAPGDSDKQSTDLVVLWKTIDSKSVDLHRLKCSVHSSVHSDAIVALSSKQNGTYKSNGVGIDDMDFQRQDPSKKLERLCQAIQKLDEKLQKNTRDFRHLVLVFVSVIIVLIAIVVYMYSHPIVLSPQTCDIPNLSISTSGTDQTNV